MKRSVLPLLVGLLFAGTAAAAQNAQGRTVVAGVRVPAGSDQQIREHLSRELRDRLSTTVILTDGERTVERQRRHLGVGLDLDRMMEGVRERREWVPLALSVNQPTLQAALERIGRDFRTSPRNAKPYMHEGEFHIDEGSYGQRLDIEETASRIAERIREDPATRKIEVATARTESPNLTVARLEGINGRLSTFSTRAAPNPNRDRNISISVNLINGTLLAPGQTFSLNDRVGPRTRERGFEAATVFVEAEKVEGLGGGLSQVTGTLFNAAALAGLQIDEVHPHSRPVGYLPLGRDATVAWQALDLKFTNNTDAPIYIDYRFEDQRLTATIFGQKVEGREVDLTARVQRHSPGHITAQLYRTITRNGDTEDKSQLFDHTYKWEP